jgi:Ala-tRNA(Pro) deacylase
MSSIESGKRHEHRKSTEELPGKQGGGVPAEDPPPQLLPSDYHVDLQVLQGLLHQEVKLATESEVKTLFSDCETGAVPPIGAAYGVKTIWDPNTSLGRLTKIYFEAGDHQHLVGVSGEQFHELMASAERGKFSRHI